MKGTRLSRRYPVEVKQRDCHLCVITFKDFAWKDHVALLVDISRHGAGLESEGQIEPGFVWFRDRLGGHKAGVLMWSRQAGSRFRAGVRFVPLSRSEEHFINEQISLVRSNQQLQDPVAVMTTIMESLTNSTMPPSVPASPPVAANAAAKPASSNEDDDIIGDLRKIVSSV